MRAHSDRWLRSSVGPIPRRTSGGGRHLPIGVVVLVAAGCAASPHDATPPATSAPPTTVAGPSASPTPTVAGPSASPATTAQAQTEDSYRPADLDWVPSDEELARMTLEAEHAYRAHWAAYDAAALTGFTDQESLEVLLASAGEDTLESLHLQVDAVGDTGRVLEGVTEIVGIQDVALNPPEEGGWGIGIQFDACVLMQGVLQESDGTVVREIGDSEPRFLRLRLVDDDGAWLLVSQTEQEGPCPADLIGRGIDAG